MRRLHFLLNAQTEGLSSRQMPRHPRHVLAARIMSRLEQLAAVTSVEGEITRFYLTREHAAAVGLISGWMTEAGLAVEVDPAGTLIGRKEGVARAAKTLLIGSHIDTVANAGRFDGCLGVVVAIEAMAELRRLGKSLPYSVEVVAFGGAEASRFPSMLVGSRVLAGGAPPGALEVADSDGVTLRQALTEFGCEPDKIPDAARRTSDLLGYVEVHIEHGPVLEGEGVSVGVVTMISGESRFDVEVRGKAGHASTLPMKVRRDAISGAAEMLLAIEDVARSTAGLLATVGKFSIKPGSVSVVPEQADFCVDVRSPVDGVRRSGWREIDRRARAIARLRRLTYKATETFNEKAVACDQRLIRQLTSAAERIGVPCIGLPSGAAHDGLAISRLCPIGMLFVRCKGGVSHQPEESVSAEDVEASVRVLLEFLAQFSPNGRTLS